MKKTLSFALLVRGFTAIAAQVLLIRELLVSFYGNEISIGIILGNWLILEAVGSGIIGRMADKVKSKIEVFAALQILIALSLPIVVYGARIVKNLIALAPGQGLGLFPIFYSSLLILAPLSLCDGTLFSFGCKIYARLTKKDAASIGRVYIYEAIGATLGGLIFTLVLIRYFHSFQIVLGLAILNLISAALLLIASTETEASNKHPKELLKIASIILLCLTFYLLFSPRADQMHNHSIGRQYKGYEVLDYKNSIYGNVTTVKREEQITFLSDGIPICNTPVPDITFVEELVHFSLLFHPRPEKVLLVSGGVGGVLNEILKHPVESVDYAELDPLIINAVQKFATPLTAYELKNPKVKINHIDGRLFVKQAKGNYDLVMVNLPDPSTLQLNRFYTKEFFRMAQDILGHEGILVIMSPGSSAYLNQELRYLNACIYNTLQGVFPYIRVIPGDFNLFLASSSPEVSTLDTRTLIRRMKKRHLRTKLVTEFHIRYKLHPGRRDWFIGSLKNTKGVRHNKDLVPSGVFYDLAYWNSLFSPYLSKLFTLTRRINIWVFLIPILLFISRSLKKQTAKSSRMAIAYSISTTGFSGMVFNMVLIFAFQSLYGYVYHSIGLLVTGFMVGLCLGGFLMTRHLDKIQKGKQTFLKLESLILVYSLLLPTALIFLHSYVSRGSLFYAVQILLIVFSFLSGFLVGSEFPLANKLYLKDREHLSQSAGTLYASDLIGGWVGAILVSVLLIPLLGIFQTCILVAGLKLSSLLFLSYGHDIKRVFVF